MCRTDDLHFSLPFKFNENYRTNENKIFNELVWLIQFSLIWLQFWWHYFICGRSIVSSKIEVHTTIWCIMWVRLRSQSQRPTNPNILVIYGWKWKLEHFRCRVNTLRNSCCFYLNCIGNYCVLFIVFDIWIGNGGVFNVFVCHCLLYVH